jgi:hypothetical protein
VTAKPSQAASQVPAPSFPGNAWALSQAGWSRPTTASGRVRSGDMANSKRCKIDALTSLKTYGKVFQICVEGRRQTAMSVKRGSDKVLQGNDITSLSLKSVWSTKSFSDRQHVFFFTLLVAPRPPLQRSLPLAAPEKSMSRSRNASGQGTFDGGIFGPLRHHFDKRPACQRRFPPVRSSAWYILVKVYSVHIEALGL